MANYTFEPLSKYDWSLHPALISVALPWNPTVYCLIAAFCAVSLWMTVELTLQVFLTFKRHRGLYFWSILICTWGVSLHVTGLILQLFNDANWILSSLIFMTGWASNVTGFSFVLYSRLNLVIRNRKILRAVLIMIITDAFLLHTPTIIFTIGIASPHPLIWIRPLQAMERIQVIGFSAQEAIISVLYIYHTRSFLQDTYTKQTRRVMQLLVLAQLLSMLGDIVLITVDYDNMFTLKVIIHPFVYAVKLRMEFIVLNQLLALIKHGLSPSNFPAPDEETPDASAPQTRNHVSFPSSDKTATATAEKFEPNPTDGPLSTAPKIEPTVPIRHPTFYVQPDTISPVDGLDSSTFYPMDPLEIRQGGGLDTYMPPRSLSDPMPLRKSQRDGDSDQVIADLERQYLGRFGRPSPLRH